MSQVVYQIDPVHSAAHFSVRHLMVSNVRGEFSKVSGTIHFDAQNPANSTVKATIDASSIQTRDERRDGHLKSADFLDVEKFPSITFESTRVEAHGDGGKITGNLTIHGVTHEVVLEVEGPSAEINDPMGMQRIGASASTKISRKEFGLTYNAALETGGVMIGDEVKITLDIEALRS